MQKKQPYIWRRNNLINSEFLKTLILKANFPQRPVGRGGALCAHVCANVAGSPSAALSLTFWDRVSCWTWGSLTWLACLESMLSQLFCFCFPKSTGVHCHTSWFYNGEWTRAFLFPQQEQPEAVRLKTQRGTGAGAGFSLGNEKIWQQDYTLVCTKSTSARREGFTVWKLIHNEK